MFKSETKPVQGTTKVAPEKGEKQELNIHYSQKSLAYFPTYATYCTYYLTDRNLNAHKLWQGLANTIDAYCAKTDYKTTVILGVGFELWTTWSSQLGYTLPKGMGNKNKLTEYGQVFGNTGGDLWFHIKSDEEKNAKEVFEIINEAITPISNQEANIIVSAQKETWRKSIRRTFYRRTYKPGRC